MAHSNRRPRRSHDADQLVLPFNKPEDLRIAWDSMDHRIAGFKSKARFQQGREVLMAIKFCGSHDGCRAHVNTLINVANRNSAPDWPVIRSRRQFFLVARELRELGFLQSEANWNERGQAPSDREVCEERIAQVVAATRELRRSKKQHSPRTHPAPTLRPSSAHSLLNSNLQSSETLKASQAASAAAHGTHGHEAEAAIKSLLTKIHEQKRFPVPRKIEPAIRQAIANGCSLDQVLAMLRWWDEHYLKCPPQHRAGTLHDRIAAAMPSQRVESLWPYWDGHEFAKPRNSSDDPHGNIASARAYLERHELADRSGVLPGGFGAEN